ncbi:DNA replication and repair protein RecF [Lachnospiraceae bacterium]|nr:DNA replication and repair protein RecF [Lachnospiraceae bacterium]
MIINRLELKQFRNYESLELDLSPGTNILYGNNAQGKTNILEALYVACTTKSHKKSKDREMIRFGSEEAHIRLLLEKKEIPYKIDTHLRKSKKKSIAVNGLPLRRASELMGIANVVFFSPEDLNIIKNGPAERRRFIDMELCQLDKMYLSDLTNYNKCLGQKNALLKEIISDRQKRDSLIDTLDIWDEQLVFYGERVISRREKFLQELNEIIHVEHRNLTGSDDDFQICYEPDAKAEDFSVKLKNSRAKDLRYGSANVGPQRDDINFLLNGVDIRKYGSQGQQRTVSLALKMSEIELVKREIHDAPVLLLDDVLSELDSNRQRYLLESIGSIQTVITCTGLDEFIRNRFEIDRVFYVENANVTEQSKKGS